MAKLDPGPGVDAPIDPTANVLKLVEEAARRMDDMRAADSRRLDDMLVMASKRLDDLLDTKVEYIEKMNGQRDLHSMELREAESARVDAVRAIDVAAVQQAAAVVATQATTLAAQVATSAETLRNQVAAAATASSAALAAALGPVQKDISELRKAQYEAQGQKAQIVESGGIGRTWVGLAVAAAGLVITLMMGTVGIALTLLLRGN